MPKAINTSVKQVMVSKTNASPAVTDAPIKHPGMTASVPPGLPMAARMRKAPIVAPFEWGMRLIRQHRGMAKTYQLFGKERIELLVGRWPDEQRIH